MMFLHKAKSLISGMWIDGIVDVNLFTGKFQTNTDPIDIYTVSTVVPGFKVNGHEVVTGDVFLDKFGVMGSETDYLYITFDDKELFQFVVSDRNEFTMPLNEFDFEEMKIVGHISDPEWKEYFN